MRSPVRRAMVELALRVTGLGALGAAAMILVRANPELPQRWMATEADSGMLAAWTARPRAEALHLALSRAPGPLSRDWLAALARSGEPVTWSDAGVMPLAVEISGRADPAGGVWVAVAGAGHPVSVSDSLGPLSSLIGPDAPWRGPVGSLSLGAVPLSGELRVVSGSDTARVSVPARPRAAAAIFGRAGWEARFAVAALEERGWTVHAAFEVAPGIEVRQGQPDRLDTSVVGVVVVLDTLSFGRARRAAAFVREGGGLVMGPRAGIAELAAAQLGDRVTARSISFAAGEPRRALAFWRLTPGSGATVLEREAGSATVVAHRVGAGRVVQFAYEDTWRWRMQGGPDATAEHRDWWSALLAAAAHRGSGAAGLDPAPAPRAALVEALGQPVAPLRDLPAPADPLRFLPLLAAVSFGSLAAEWGLRRAAGRK